MCHLPYNCHLHSQWARLRHAKFACHIHVSFAPTLTETRRSGSLFFLFYSYGLALFMHRLFFFVILGLFQLSVVGDEFFHARKKSPLPALRGDVSISTI